MRKIFLRLAGDEEGQAVVEYILMLSVVLGTVGALAGGLRKTLFALWQSLAQDITAACPGCPPDPSIKLN